MGSLSAPDLTPKSAVWQKRKLRIYRPVSQYRMNSEEVPDSSIVNLGVVLRNVLLANSA